NSVEYTGQANVDLTAARPATQLHSIRHIARDDLPSEPESPQDQEAKTPVTPESFGKLGSLTLNRGDSYLDSAVVDTAQALLTSAQLTTLVPWLRCGSRTSPASAL